MIFSQFTRRQWLTAIVFGIANFFQAICVSLQAPFYPAEAEKKGATATEYGLVFGIFELTVFIVSPIMGKNLQRLGAKRVFNTGILITGSCSVLFGFLDRINSGSVFIGLSFFIRIVEAVGNSGFLTASFSIIAKEFPDNVATMFALLETCFGFGLIAGPTVGGALYQLGGFLLPFASLGACLVTVAITTFFLLPHQNAQTPEEADKGPECDRGMLSALRIPTISLAVFSILCASSSIGFLLTALEPHLRQFDLSPFMMGIMFMINGGSYAGCAPVFGILCDRGLNPVLINVFGAFAILFAFLFIGPAPFIPMPTMLPVCIMALVLHGLGIGAMLVSNFASAHRQAIQNGFPDTLYTYGLMSGLWTSTFALGAFVGPSVAGLLMDHYGMKNATLFIVTFAVVVLFATASFYGIRNYRRCCVATDYNTLEPTETNLGSTSRYGSLDTRQSRSPSIGYNTGPSSSSATGSAQSTPSASVSRRNSSYPIVTAVDVHPCSSSSVLTPMSSFQCGSTGLFGGVMGFSVPIHIGGRAASHVSIDRRAHFHGSSVPHQILGDEELMAQPILAAPIAPAPPRPKKTKKRQQQGDESRKSSSDDTNP